MAAQTSRPYLYGGAIRHHRPKFIRYSIVKMRAFEFEQSGVFSLTPPDVAEIANNAYTDLLPEKSRAIYEETYSEFMTWCEEKHITR